SLISTHFFLGTSHTKTPRGIVGRIQTINLRLFKNPFRPSQLAENTERILNEIVELISKTHPPHNALLRCEQRNTYATAYHLKH
ncbi:hypothetical protein, partial [Vibrio aestuarianus]|uniref:hypothetical protein n=1 Tax=Vibrio aestuarianus TaxID=28171 RepID=UPI0030B99173